MNMFNFRTAIMDQRDKTAEAMAGVAAEITLIGQRAAALLDEHDRLAKIMDADMASKLAAIDAMIGAPEAEPMREAAE